MHVCVCVCVEKEGKAGHCKQQRSQIITPVLSCSAIHSKRAENLVLTSNEHWYDKWAWPSHNRTSTPTTVDLIPQTPPDFPKLATTYYKWWRAGWWVPGNRTMLRAAIKKFGHCIEQSMNHISLSLSHPLNRTCVPQYQTSSWTQTNVQVYTTTTNPQWPLNSYSTGGQGFILNEPCPWTIPSDSICLLP